MKNRQFFNTILFIVLFALSIVQSNAAAPFLGNTSKEIKASVIKYTKAAEQGDIQAQYYLGCMYYGGIGVSQNDAEALVWWRKSADIGHARSMNNIGSMYFEGRGGLEKNQDEALKWWIKGSESGDNYAKANLAFAYYNNGSAPRSDIEKAISLFTQLANENNDSDAQFTLGEIYYWGGSDDEKKQAKKWWELAAKQGHMEAQSRLKTYARLIKE